MESVGNEVYKAEGISEPIDIILPTHGKLEELTIPCLNALYANTRNLFHLIVVDDSTTDMDDGRDQTVQWFKRTQILQGNITFLHSETPFNNGNQIFNIALAHGQNRFIATVMNSITVEPDWDIVPAQMMASKPKIGIIGMKTLKAGTKEEDGLIEHAGINMTGFTPCDMGKNEAGHRRACSYPVFSTQWAFALLRREAVVGNLDEHLWRGFVGFDDIDNTVYIRYKGWEAWYCGLGVGYHKAHATRGYKNYDDDEKILKNSINAEIFYKRWGYWEEFRRKNPYAPERFPNGEVGFITNANELPLEINNG